MNLSQRLRTCARHTGLDAVIELLTEAADEIDRLSAGEAADVTDEQIAACVKRASTYGLPFVGLLNPGGAPSEFSKRFTAEILALRPVQVPMDKQDAWDNSPVNSDWEAVDAYLQGIEDAEAHHGITAQAKKETL